MSQSDQKNQKSRFALPRLDPERLIGLPAGICSGATKLLVGHPFDTIKVRMQTEGGMGRFNGPLDCLMKTLRNEGFRALYKGATPPLIGWTMMDATQMLALTNFRWLLTQYNGENQGTGTLGLSLGQHALAGFGAGIVVSFVATPVELLKAKLQVQYGGTSERVYKGPIHAARLLVRHHGVSGLFQGLHGCLMFRSFFWVLWGSYEVYSQQLIRWGFDASSTAFLAGGLAANTFWTISYPCDVIKNRMMAQPDPGKGAPLSAWKYPTVASCFKSIYAAEGVKGFYRGFVPCFLRSFPTNGAAILVFETVSSATRSLIKN